MRYIKGKLILNQDAYVTILFILSLLHPIFGLFFYFGLLKIVLDSGVVGAIKYIIILSLRGLLSVKIGVSLGSLNTLKLIIFMSLSLYIIYVSVFKKSLKKNNFFIILSCILFCLVAIFFSFISGSYPITSTFKSISFGLVFLGIILGISGTKDKINWSKYLLRILTPFFVISFLLIPFPSYKLINNSFQGVFNHVNLCGIMCTSYITCLLVNKPEARNEHILQIIFIVATFIMLFLTSSRTGMFVSIIVIAFNFILHNHYKTTYLIIGLSILTCISIYFLNDRVNSLVNTTVFEYVYKNNENDVFASRRDTQKMSIHKYKANPLVGSGFMTPYIDDYVDYSLNFSLTVEPGSIIWSLFGDVGILGTIIFIIFVIVIVLSGNIKNLFLVMSVIGVCSGEMVFFSVNSMAVIFYALLALYITSND